MRESSNCVFSIGNMPDVINAKQIREIQTSIVNMLYFRCVFKACIFLECAVCCWIYFSFCAEILTWPHISVWLLLPIVPFYIGTFLPLEMWILLYLLFFLCDTHEIEIYFMLSFTGKTSLSATVFVNSELLRNSTNLDEGKVFHEFDCLFQVIFSFSHLSREGSSEEGAEEGK